MQCDTNESEFAKNLTVACFLSRWSVMFWIESHTLDIWMPNSSIDES